MASNDDLLVSIGADFTQLRRDLATAEKFFQDFAKDVQATARRNDLLGDLNEQGRRAAASLLGGLKAQLTSSESSLRDQLSRNLIDRKQFEIAGTRAAEEFNAALAQGISELDAQGMLPPGLKRELISEFKDIGESSAQQLADALADRMDKIGGRIRGAGQTITAAIGLPLAALGAGAVKASESIDDAMDRLRITTGRTGDQLAELERDFNQLFEGVPSSARDVSTAIAELSVRTGAHGEQLKDLATEYLTLSRLLDTDVKGSIEGTQRLFRQFSVGVNDQGAALNFLFKTAQQTGTRFDSLAADLTRFGPALRQLGFNFKESAALVAQFSREGVDVDTILNRMSQALVQFARRGISAPQALDALIQQIKRADSDTKAINIAANIFGSRGAAGFAAAVREGRIGFEDLLRTIDQSPESIAAAAEATDGFKESVQQLQNQLTRALEPLGVELVSTFRDLTPTIVSTIRIVAGLARQFAALPDSVKNTAIAFGGIGIALGPVLIGIGSLVQGLAGIIRIAPGVIQALRGIASAEGLAALGSLLLPGGVILVGLGLVAAAIYASGQAARDVQRDIDGYARSLANLGPAALPALFKSTQEMEAQVAALKKSRDEIALIQGETVKSSTATSMGVVTTTVRNPNLAAIDDQLKRLEPMLAAAKQRFNQLLDAELRTETGTHGLTSALGKVPPAIAAINGSDFNFGDKILTADQIVAQFIGNVRGLMGAFKDLQRTQAVPPELVDRLFDAHKRVSDLLAREKDQYSTQALALGDIKRGLEAIEAVQLRIFRQKLDTQGRDVPTVEVPKITAATVEIPKSLPAITVPIMLLTPEQVRINQNDIPPLNIPVEKIFLSPKVLSDFQRALAAEIQTKGALDAATLFGTDADIKDAAKRAADAADVLRVAMRALKVDIENSLLPDKEKKRILEEMAEAAKKAGLASRDAGTSISKNVGKLDIAVTVGRGLTNILSSIKGIDQATVQMTRSVIDAVDAFKQLKVARASGDTLGVIGGTIGVVGGLISFATSLADMFNKDREERRAIQREANEVAKANTDALDALRVRNEGFTGAVGDLSAILKGIQSGVPGGLGAQIVGKVDFPGGLIGSALKQAFERASQIRGDAREAFDQQLRATGTSLRALEQFAKTAGIQLFDSAGKVIPNAFDDLQEAIRLTIDEMIHFQNTLQDQRSIQSLVQDVFDVDQTPIQKMQNELDLVSKLAPQLFEKFFAGIDTSTQEGRDALEGALRRLVVALRDGTIDLADFGKLLGKDELSEIIRNTDNSLDELAKAADTAAGSLVNVPTGFAVAKRVFDAITADLNAREALINRVITAPPPQPVPVPTTPIQTTPPPPSGGTGPGAVTKPQFNIDLGGISIEVDELAPDTDIEVLLGRLRERLIAKLRTINPQSVEAFLKLWPA